MSEFEIHKVKHTIETNQADESDEYLALGWVLLGVCRASDDPANPLSNQSFRFVLGWDRDEEPKRPPSVLDYLRQVEP